MKCYFCQKETIPHNIFAKTGMCPNHKLEVHQIQCVPPIDDDTPDFLYYTTYHNDKEYEIWMYLTGRPHFYCKFEVAYRPKDNQNKRVQVVILDFIPNHITPDNISQKLPTLLVFS